MTYTIQKIAEIINANSRIVTNEIIDQIIYDSRKITVPKTSLFFALHTNRKNGHDFINEVYERGVRNFVIDENFNTSTFTDCNFLIVKNTLDSLQQLVANHRKQFKLPTIGITGSNGKTIVKEWLNQLLQTNYNIVRSPRSYNSQIGVPISVWQINKDHNLGIFEAGISTINEMEKLERIIQPTIGILTNIGTAHDDGFINSTEKVIEKLKLFNNVDTLIFNSDNGIVTKLISENITANLLTWGKSDHAQLKIIKQNISTSSTTINAIFKNENIDVTIPFTDEASINNACTCWVTLLFLNISQQNIQHYFKQLHSVEMRMQLLPISNNCVLLNDSYSNDSSSFYIALNYLISNAANNKKTIIVSDFSESVKQNSDLYKKFIEQIGDKKVTKIICIGNTHFLFKEAYEKLNIECYFYNTTESFLTATTTHAFKNEYILLKGSRVFNFEKIAKWLQQKTHQTVMEINLTALIYNLKEYQKHLLPTTKTMAMVKAFSYGSGSVEIAKTLQYYKVDYLGVAYADEGIELRNAGISLPILVLNVDEENFDSLIEFNLEPEIYSFNIYHSFHTYLLTQGIQNFPVHIKFNTGMNRLGFEVDDALNIGNLLVKNKSMHVQSVLSHLVASDTENLDSYTLQQFKIFDDICNKLFNCLNYKFIKHIANSASIFRHPNSQYDMVRLGIGLYGVDTTKNLSLQTVSTLKTTIAQIRTVKKTETIGYNKQGILIRDSKIATVRLGYADGLNRSLSNQVGSMFLHGKLAPIVGNICMDMAMIDITDIDEAKENDVVEIFGKNISVEQVAKWSNTIAYETLSTISQRVRRIYFEE